MAAFTTGVFFLLCVFLIRRCVLRQRSLWSCVDALLLYAACQASAVVGLQLLQPGGSMKGGRRGSQGLCWCMWGRVQCILSDTLVLGLKEWGGQRVGS
jgi:hypothetical protein